ncbi:uncharacterized protein LOC117894825 isoform X1 [Drosophila subobscura]|uniref:uncharacterized protein LOC117894825 isoform X1 n=1 Tax=Drosophila subobscura TaxID=7241 RepID=UPI00155A7625|nr:uncharacterized protein LOC117894825 isoform X1 [Drosophila subobscura]
MSARPGLHKVKNPESPKRTAPQSVDAVDEEDNKCPFNEDFIRESAANFEEGSSGEEDKNETGEDVVPDKQRSWHFYGIGIPLMIIILSMAAWYYIYAEKSCAFKTQRGIEPKQSDRVWMALQKGIEGLINKRDPRPSVFLFLHQEEELKTLIDEIATEASRCFGGPGKPVHMNKDDFVPKNGDYGFAIEQFKKKLQEGNVFLIVNLNEIPPRSARALHPICDTYNPIAADAVIFLTLHTSSTTDTGNSVELARQTLYELWGTQLQDNELEPLITRVTDQVLHLNSTG